MNIPIARPFFGLEEEEAVLAVIRSGWVSQGPKVREFEEVFASAVGARHAVAMTSCTTALHAALAVSGIGPGDDVIVPSLSFIATANAVVHAAARPVFADVDPETCNLTVETIERAMTPKTRAAICVHQMGLPADLDPIMEFCGSRGLLLIEDAACAIGSEYKGRRIGGHGNVACFSFHPRKVITTGEGGMITTDDGGLAEKLRRFRHHGMSVSDLERHLATTVVLESYPEIGYNYRMTDIQAAIGIVQMRKLPVIVGRRRVLAERYTRALSNVGGIRMCRIPEYVFHNFQSYWIELVGASRGERDRIMQALLDRGITTRRGIMAIHHEERYRDSGAILPVTDRLTDNSILLPIFPAMTELEQGWVIAGVMEAAA